VRWILSGLLLVLVVYSLLTSTALASQSTSHNGSFPSGYDLDIQLNNPMYQQNYIYIHNIQKESLTDRKRVAK